jgi:hypothetical protein
MAALRSIPGLLDQARRDQFATDVSWTITINRRPRTAMQELDWGNALFRALDRIRRDEELQRRLFGQELTRFESAAVGIEVGDVQRNVHAHVVHETWHTGRTNMWAVRDRMKEYLAEELDLEGDPHVRVHFTLMESSAQKNYALKKQRQNPFHVPRLPRPPPRTETGVPLPGQGFPRTERGEPILGSNAYGFPRTTQ